MPGKNIDVRELATVKDFLSCGDKVFLSGVIYTARDAAHKRLTEMLEKGERLPFSIENAVIYYAGPTPSKPDGTIGSFGPTTSSRMDAFSPRFLDMGLLAMIGKGNRSKEVVDAIIRNKALYFCAGGGFGALISNSVTGVEEIAFSELGCESIKKLTVCDMPLITAIDSRGNSVFNR